MKALYLKKINAWLIIGGLLLIAGCVGGEVQTYRPSSYPVYTSPYYYPYLRYQEDDPQFWLMQQDRNGGP